MLFIYILTQYAFNSMKSLKNITNLWCRCSGSIILSTLLNWYIIIISIILLLWCNYWCKSCLYIIWKYFLYNKNKIYLVTKYLLHPKIDILIWGPYSRLLWILLNRSSFLRSALFLSSLQFTVNAKSRIIPKSSVLWNDKNNKN